ncbi:MFS-type transporter SLC18B1-like [Symsagittifera roscoffensis]|uniref:MFS-type transporter SLC18B1-like n=1 Tax=Symsagittifera roscoffensis TaxID=84072 RepID=UPI00307B4A0E
MIFTEEFVASAKLFVALGLSILIYMADGINLSQLAPFFPNEAELNKGVSELLVGAITGCFDFSMLFFSILLPFVVKPEWNKLLFFSGALLGALFNMVFGLVDVINSSQWFASLSFICRLFMGLGGALVWGTGIPLLTSIAPEYAGRVTSLAESAIGFGLAIGPPLGSAMYSLGGYELPFLTSGAIELVLALLVFYALPNGPADEDNEKKSLLDKKTDGDGEEAEPMLKKTDESFQNESPEIPSTFRAALDFLAIRGIWVYSVFLILLGVPLALLDVALSPYLLEQFDIEGDFSGWYFLAAGAFYAVCSQFVGWATDKGFAAHSFFWLSNMLIIVTGMYSLPLLMPFLENKYYVVFVLALNGIAMSGTFVPIYLILQEIAQKGGYSHDLENLQLVVGFWVTFTLSAGRILGSVVFGGLIYPAIEFEMTFLSVCGCLIVGSVCSNGYLLFSGNYRKMYYTEE